jgi:hypothetical protein
MAKKSTAKEKAPVAEKAPVVKPTVAGTSLAAFAQNFLADLPPEAAGGRYAPTINDRWHGKTFAIEDGPHRLGDWRFIFAGGRFVHASTFADG